MTISRYTVAREIRWAIEDAKTAYKECMASDEQLVRDSLKPGQAMPKHDKIMMDTSRRELNRRTDAAKASALKAIDSAIGTAKKNLVTAPKDGEAAYIASIAGRSDLSAREVEVALDTYRSHASQRAILAAAARSGFKDYGSTTAEEKELSALEQLRADTESAFNPGKFNYSPASLEWFNITTVGPYENGGDL